RVESFDDLNGVHDLLELEAHGLCDLLVLLALDLGEMIADDIHRKAVVFTEGAELQHEALAQIAGRNSWRVESLDDMKITLDLFQQVFPAFGNLFRSYGNFPPCLIDCAEVAILIEIPNNRMARQTHVRFN